MNGGSATMETRPGYRLGIDIGGTFTDATLIDVGTGAIRIGKVASTPDDPSRGFAQATERMLRESGVSPADIGSVVHATTVATNAIIEGNTAATGFVTTAGFRRSEEHTSELQSLRQ